MAKVLKLEESVARLVTYGELRERGLSKAKIARRVREKRLVRVCQGVYLDPVVETKFLESQHLLRTAGFVMSSRCEWTISHWSAVLMHGLPAWGMTLDKVSVARDSASSRSISTASSIRRFTTLPPEDITNIAGFKVTGIERTLLDVSLTCGFAAAVVAIESALYRRLVSKHVLVEYFGSKRNLNNLPEGLKALAFASMHSESVLESRSRLFFDHFAIPMPEQQVTITVRSGRRYRVDFLWRGLKLIGEADGKKKILDGAENEQSARLGRHWQREEDLRAEGYTFVRWGWEDLVKPAELNARLESAFAQAQRLAA